MQLRGQAVGIDPGLDPAEQSLWRRGERETCLLGQAHAALARGMQARDHTLGMATQSTLLEQMASARSGRDGVVSAVSSLVSMTRSTRAGDAARKPTRQLGVRIFEKPET